MAAWVCLGSRQIQTWRAGSGFSCGCRFGSDPRRGDHRHSVSDTLEDRSDARRAPSARPGISMPFRDCAQNPWVFIVKSGGLLVEFDEGDGLKNLCRSRRKSSIRQVLISRTLSVYGEVAERLKAAVC